MTKAKNNDYAADAMIYTTDHGSMIVSWHHPHPQPVTDPTLLASLFGDEPPVS